MKYYVGELVIVFIDLPDDRVVNFCGTVISIDKYKNSIYYKLRLADGGRITVDEKELRKLTDLEKVIYGI